MHDQYYQNPARYHPIVSTVLRVLHITFAVVVVVIYAIDLKTATQHHAIADSSWIFAEVVAGLSMITCGLYCYLSVKHVLWCIWDLVLFILWLTIFGRFASLNLSAANATLNEPLTTSVPRMKTAIWIDLVNTLLWLATLVQTVIYRCGSTRRCPKTSEEVLISGGDEECGELAADDDVLAVRAEPWPASSAKLQKALRSDDDDENDDDVAWDSASTRPPSYTSELEVIDDDSVAE